MRSAETTESSSVEVIVASEGADGPKVLQKFKQGVS
jgi:hypothetical protein